MTTTSPHPVDLHVGARLRQRRHMVGLSQSDLATALGLTFQQMQKYERGANRISASKLYAAACKLETPVAWFFEGLETGLVDGFEIADDRSAGLQAFLSTRDGLELASLVPRIRPLERRRLVALVSALAADD